MLPCRRSKGMGAAERAYRSRVERARWALLAAAMAFVAASHYTFGPAFYPLVAASMLCVGLAVRGMPLLFPVGWSAFDSSNASPTLEAEARALARTMGVRIDGLRASPAHSERPTVRWSGRIAVVSDAMRDLPPAERRFALARALVHAPGGPELFRQYGAWPTFFGWFSAWAFGYPRLAWCLALALAAWAALSLVRLYRRDMSATARALAATGDRDAALAYLRRERDRGSLWAAREAAALEAPSDPC
jgi:hypothetical protein